MSSKLHRVWSTLGLVFLAACAGAPAPFSDADRQAVEAEVREIMAELTDAMNAHDGEGVTGRYAEDPGFLYLGCTDFVTGGINFRNMIRPYYGPSSDLTFQQRIVSVQVLSPTAAVVVQRGSSTRAEALFWTQVLEKRDERWLVTYEHESWPGCAPPKVPHPFTAAADSAGLVPGGMVR